MRRAIPWGVACECEEVLDEGGGEPSACGASGAAGEVPPCDESTVSEKLKHAAALAAGQEHGQWAFQDGLVDAPRTRTRHGTLLTSTGHQSGQTRTYHPATASDEPPSDTALHQRSDDDAVLDSPLNPARPHWTTGTAAQVRTSGNDSV